MLIMHLWIIFWLISISWMIFFILKTNYNNFSDFVSGLPKITNIFFVLLIFLSLIWTILVIIFNYNWEVKVDTNNYEDKMIY